MRLLFLLTIRSGYLQTVPAPKFYVFPPPLLCRGLRNTRLYTSGTPPQASNETSSALRNIMRKIPHPVVIVTSATSSSPQTWRGITLSSFNCFSLNPHPLVSFNIKTPSSAASTMTKAGSFAVHILRPSPRSAFLASKFAQLGATNSTKISPFSFTQSQITLANATFGSPLLGREDDVMFRLQCETHRTIQIEDHQLWVGKVTKVDVVAEEKYVAGTGLEEVFSLMYSDRHFRHVGETLVPHEGAAVEEEVEENMDDGSLLAEERGSGR
ncbi:uncharacterized protein LAJ45_00734 [Morchella importuna]|nr:uncharacterized protein LAJ45_00734 [Morchella importuna]KAH8155724.1 hypothetical protein LAJ45_00734 [Morchella importuna]